MMTDYVTRADLFARGLSRRAIQAAVRGGALIHVRRDRYLEPGPDDTLIRAVRVGGRLTCLSLLQLLGVFVLRSTQLHVHVDPTASRLRSPHDKSKRLATARSGVRLHWTVPVEENGPGCAVSIVDALVHAVLCQAPTAAVATLDSALNKGIILAEDVRRVFAALPSRYQVLASFVDGSAESGPETLVRMMARRLGCRIRPQVEVDGVGRVDFILDGWLVVECDSRAFHADWEAQVRDRERDLALATLGYCTLRLTAAAIMYRPDEVSAALGGLIRSRRPV
jgi:very-short-patch-repair endonuclease